MVHFMARLVARAVTTLVLVTAFIFFFYRLTPGHGSTVIPGFSDTPEQVAALNAEPGILQYLRILRQWATGNFGYYPRFNEPIATVLAQALPITVVLVAGAMLVSFVVAIPLGIIQGLNHGGVVDHALTGVEFLFFSAPLILTAPLLANWFSFDVPLFPPQAPPGETFGAVLGHFNSMVLPIVTLALPLIGRLSRYVRSSVLDQVSLDYLVVARSKGCGPFRLVRKHLMRNAMIPILTFLGISLPLLVSGGLVVEALFNLPGIGYLLWLAGNPKRVFFSFPLEIAILVVASAALVLANLLVDVAMRIVDPRTRQ
ncbi:ABC transporter permease [Arthrobacter sp. STN4]|uniref:ABC transporter permease n=1 Tax=Arthrobacter sp. STN4 TaxID=2923276 RepID=UPI00211A3D78|nr:ABC transporter permease [Arthrobacter sp. STN4]MCQ9163174.1 ABC transporter permease [Arthrobacter sp. STN4]